MVSPGGLFFRLGAKLLDQGATTIAPSTATSGMAAKATDINLLIYVLPEASFRVNNA